MECSVTHSEFFRIVYGLVVSWKQARSYCDRLLERRIDAYFAFKRGDRSQEAVFLRLDGEFASRTEDGDRFADVIETVAKDLALRLSDWSDVQVASALAGNASQRTSLEDAVTHAVSGDQLWVIVDRLRDRYLEVLQSAECAVEPAPAVVDPRPGDTARAVMEISDDGRSARWGSQTFTFTPLQAQMVVRLNESRLHGTGVVSEADLQEAASETDQPVRSVFRDKKVKGPHAAIRLGFIVPAGKGLWKINNESPL